MSSLYIGTCSWKYPSWKGLVYSAAGNINYLAEYSQKYKTVEVDQWFWSLFSENAPALPKEDTVKEYIDSVPTDFLFTIKVPNSITLTHFYKKKGDKELTPNRHFLSLELFGQFLDRINPMASSIGMLMLQFEYLNKQKMKSEDEFLEQLGNFLKKVPRKYPIAIEPRNPNYLNVRYFDFLSAHDCSHVFLQGYYMPSIVEVYTKNKDFIGKTVVIRLHGTERGAIEEKAGDKWNEIVEPKDGEIDSIADMIRELKSKGVNIFLNINNHYEGSAPLTIKKIEKIIFDDSSQIAKPKQD